MALQLIKTFVDDVVEGSKSAYAQRVNATIEGAVNDANQKGYQVFKDTIIIEKDKVYFMGIYVGEVIAQKVSYTKKNWFTKKENENGVIE